MDETTIEEMKKALEYYANTFCEYGTSFLGCGRLSEDDCSGCLARSVLMKEKTE